MSPTIVHSQVGVFADVDVLVVGAGSAGCCAAIAAAEHGARVVLADRYGFLGGTSTAVLDTFYGFFTPGDAPRKVAGGIADRVVDALAASEACYLRPNTYGAGTGVTYSPERLKVVWDELVERAGGGGVGGGVGGGGEGVGAGAREERAGVGGGVEVLLHAMLVDVESDGAGRVVAGVFATKMGLVKVRARRFIDASGDADLCHHAGIGYEKAGEIDPAQTLTTTFRLANVDHATFNAAGGKKMLAEKMAAADLGRYPLPRRKGSFHAMAIPGCASTVAARVADVDATDGRELAAAEKLGRKQAFEYERFVREQVPGYGKARVCGLSVQIGVRETRRVYGEYRLTRDDCMSVRRFDDSVLLCGAPIEDHRQGKNGEDETAWAYVPGGGAYDVPYRTLVAKGRDEVWVAGRCFSATHDAHASCRSMAQTMAMGQAAGTAAALSLKADCGARGVDVGRLRETLVADGAVLEVPETVAQTAADAWSKNRETER